MQTVHSSKTTHSINRMMYQLRTQTESGQDIPGRASIAATPLLSPTVQPNTSIIRSTITTTTSIPPMINTTTSMSNPMAPSVIPIIQNSNLPMTNHNGFYNDDRRKLDKYTGSDTSITADRWISLFDVVVSSITSDYQRVQLLMEYLRGEALHWYADEIAPFITTISYKETKNKFIERFGFVVVDPVIAAQKRRLQKGESIQDYFNSKMQFLRRSTLTQQSIAAQLTDGTPHFYRTPLISADIKDANHWLRKALELEESFRPYSTKRKPDYKHQNHFTKTNQATSTSKTEAKPPSPCKLCQSLGKLEWHWHRDCPRRKRTNNNDNNSAFRPSTSDQANYSSIDQCNLTSHPPEFNNPHHFIHIDASINHTKVAALIDTASSTHLISNKLTSRLNLKLQRKMAVSLQLANGTTMTLGQVTFPLTINNQTKTVTAQTLVDPPFDLLLGLNIGEFFHITCDLKERTASVHFVDEQLQPVISIPSQFQQLIHNNQDLFSEENTFADTGKITIEFHRIRTKEHPPISQRPYTQPIADRTETTRQVQELLTKGFIRESTSPWAAPITLVKKKDNTKRLCIDYRKLNSITIDDKQPIPRIQDVIDQLHNSKFFSTLDVTCGYWHVPIDPVDVSKTAFVTHNGHYEWLVMPFGLKNAPSTFQRIIQKVLGNLLNHGTINYLDDIIVYSETLGKHFELLSTIFQRLKQHNIKLKLSKCNFVQLEVEYLGHIISFNNVKPSARQIKAVTEFPEPKNVIEIRRFLGLAGFYRRFIPNFASIAEPLTRLTRKNVDFASNWKHEQLTAFNQLKSLITQPPVLTIFNPDLPCELHTDASSVGIGATLIQNHHPVAYFSRRLNESESKYNATHLECLAAVNAIEHFHIYLYDNSFNLVTDHSALQWLFNIKKPTGLLYRWSVRLSVYSYNVIHRSGLKHQHVDALSRAPSNFLVTTQDIIKAQRSLSESMANEFIQDGIKKIKRKGMTKIIVPLSLVPRILQAYHDDVSHPGQNTTLTSISKLFYWKTLTQDVHEYVKSCHTCQLVKPSLHPSFGQLKPIETPDKPLDLISIDTIVMGNIAANTKAKYVQLIVDHHSRFVWVFATPKNTTETIINILSSLFKTVGIPKSILTDNGTNFIATKLKHFLAKASQDLPFNIKHFFTTSYHPSCNGLNEKANDLIITKLRTATLENPRRKWSTLLPSVVDNYNQTVHGSTGFTPKFLFNGSDDNIPNKPTLSDARIQAKQRSDQLKLKWKQRFDEKHESLVLKEGNMVKRRIPFNRPDRHKLTPKYEGPFTIVKVHSDINFEIDQPHRNQKTTLVHVSQLEPYFTRSPRLNLTAGE